MTKIEAVSFEYEHCGDCYHAYDKTCDLTGKKIPEMWGKIPDWCPLENKSTKDELLKQKVIEY